MGLIVGVNNAKGKSGTWFSKLQRVFTRADVTHSFVQLKNYYDEPVILDAQERITLDFLDNLTNNPLMDVWLYEIPMHKTKAEDIEKTLLKEFIGKRYGYFQILWFVWRWFNEFILKRDIRKKNNWFTDGVICSEILYRAVELVGFKVDLKYLCYIKPWNKDTFHSGDSKQILDQMVKNGDAIIFTNANN